MSFMDRHSKNMKRENELLDAIKTSNTYVVQRILSKCRSGKSSTYREIKTYRLIIYTIL
jgi:hypothetical protein